MSDNRKKLTINVYPFAYNKILGGQRKIDIRPYVRALHSLRVGDTVEYVNLENKTSLVREVRGIALFDNFETLISMLDPELIGYSSREEIRLRVERMYSKKQQCEYGVCALFLNELNVARLMKLNHLERTA